MPVSGAVAEYHGRRLPILFSGDGWVGLRADPDDEVPDATERGSSRVGPGHYAHWAKVPDSAIDGVIDVDVTGKLAGHTVSLRGQLPDGRIRVWFIGSPDVAQEIGLDGDQYMGWTGLVAPEELNDIHVEETRRV
ncbi:hypothetical protein [Mycobacterium sp. MMS18-G62]